MAIPYRLAEAIKGNRYLEKENIDSLSSTQLVESAVLVAEVMQEKDSVITPERFYRAAIEYGIQDLPADFLRVLYKECFTVPF